jgi:hypothetical protein
MAVAAVHAVAAGRPSKQPLAMAPRFVLTATAALALVCGGAVSQERLSVSFTNGGRVGLRFGWQNPATGEVTRPQVLLPGGSAGMRTWHGHQFAVLPLGDSPQPGVPLRVLTVDSAAGHGQIFDIATGKQQSAPPASPQPAGASHGSLDEMWRAVLRRNAAAHAQWTEAERTCSLAGAAEATTAAASEQRRCPDGTAAGLAAAMQEHGCDSAGAWLGRAGAVKGYHVLCVRPSGALARGKHNGRTQLAKTLTRPADKNAPPCDPVLRRCASPPRAGATKGTEWLRAWLRAHQSPGQWL